MKLKKAEKYETHMTYLADFVVIGMNGLFHSDWQGADPEASPIGPQLGE